ncbi:hypothetical protein QUA20_31755 [Microcoleus sp. Pol7_A1]|uniref:hypothetical protein n=1 Tax=Microcoleus sp. Pol7_A1 TaxID=2818893 RepID=UPI002FD0437C
MAVIKGVTNPDLVLLVCDSHKNSCQWDLVYCSVPAKSYNDLLGFQNDEKLTIIAIFKFHPMNRCVLAEIGESEQIQASIKLLIVEDNLLNFSLLARRFMRVNLVTYYGFDVEAVMQTVANKQVDIIIVKPNYLRKYREVNWMENIRMLKSNPHSAGALARSSIFKR